MKVVIPIIGVIFLTLISGCTKDEEEKNDDSGFCYSLRTSSELYEPITDGIEITETNSDDLFEVDLGFTFSFCGESFEKIYITWDYAPTFTYKIYNDFIDATGYELIPFGTMGIDLEGYDDLSEFRYKTTGSAGNKVTTIEWLDFEYGEAGTFNTYLLSFQIKLYENGNKIAYHYGPSNITVDFASNVFEFLTIGLYSTDETNGLFLYGDASSPSSSSSLGNEELTSWPVENTVYTFE